jgi:hypothetical protein
MCLFFIMTTKFFILQNAREMQDYRGKTTSSLSTPKLYYSRGNHGPTRNRKTKTDYTRYMINNYILLLFLTSK